MPIGYFGFHYNIIMLIGTIILVPAFAFQVFKLYFSGKHTISFSPLSWFINFIGRFLYIIYALLLPITEGSFEGAGLIIVLGQGLVTVFTIPILYYSYRNHKTHGHFSKERFNFFFLFLIVILAIITITLMLVTILVNTHVINLGIAKFDPVTEKVVEGTGISFYWVFIISLIASICTGIAFLPQGLKTIKSRNTKSTSLMLSMLFSLGNSILVIAFWTTLIENNSTRDLMMYISPSTLPVISIVVMIIITFLKLKNFIKNPVAERNIK